MEKVEISMFGYLNLQVIWDTLHNITVNMCKLYNVTFSAFLILSTHLFSHDLA